MDRKFAIEPDVEGILANQPSADGVEGAGPVQPVRQDPPFAPKTSVVMRSARRCISAAALLEKVRSRMRRGSTPHTTRWATRLASVLVFPEPAPAMIRSGEG